MQENKKLVYAFLCTEWRELKTKELCSISVIKLDNPSRKVKMRSKVPTNKETPEKKFPAHHLVSMMGYKWYEEFKFKKLDLHY